jgi:hypothetical protein
MAGHKNYVAYGLKIQSAISLDEFVLSGTGEAEVFVTFGQDPGWISEVRGDHNYYRIRRDEARFWFKDVGGFVVKDGSSVIVIPEKDHDKSCLRLYVQGMMLATILHQRDRCVLHASVVEVDGSAVAFLGAVGAGKSSVAAAMYSRGHRVLTDDNAAIEWATGTPMVVPSYPSVKLYPEIASSLGFRNGTLSVLHASLPKMAGTVAAGFVQTPLPLRRLYFLGRDCNSEVTPIPTLQAAVELIRDSVPTRWGYPGDARQFEQCGYVAKQVPAFALRTFKDLSSLPSFAEKVDSHLTDLLNK